MMSPLGLHECRVGESSDRIGHQAAIISSLGIICTGLLIVLVVATGSTFGQRCKPLTGDEWRACVDRLANGQQSVQR
jgi:hypothetical protein